MRAKVVGERAAQIASTALCRQLVDQLGSGGEQCIEAVLDCTICDGHGKMSLASSGFAFKDDGTSFGDEVWGEQRADGGQAQRGLISEVELLDRAQEGEHCRPDGAVEACGAAMGDFLLEQSTQELLMGPLLFLCSLNQVGPNASRVGEVQSFENAIEVVHECYGASFRLRAGEAEGNLPGTLGARLRRSSVVPGGIALSDARGQSTTHGADSESLLLDRI